MKCVFDGFYLLLTGFELFPLQFRDGTEEFVFNIYFSKSICCAVDDNAVSNKRLGMSIF